MSTERRALNLLRWFGLDKDTAGQLRSRTMARSLLDRYRTIGGPVDAAADKAVHQGACYSVLGTLAGGIAAGVVWGAPAWLLGPDVGS